MWRKCGTLATLARASTCRNSRQRVVLRARGPVGERQSARVTTTTPGSGDVFERFFTHGTRMAGIIAGRDNSLGVRGVAPRATVYSYNWIRNPTFVGLGDAMTRNMVRHRSVQQQLGSPSVSQTGPCPQPLGASRGCWRLQGLWWQGGLLRLLGRQRGAKQIRGTIRTSTSTPTTTPSPQYAPPMTLGREGSLFRARPQSVDLRPVRGGMASQGHNRHPELQPL